MIDLNRIEAALVTTRFPDSLTHLASTASTNQLALEAAQRGATTGIWVADEQTAGRGRGGHTWHSAAGDGLYVSVLATPQVPLERGLWISLATGLAAQCAIAEATGLKTDIRWPNDLLLNGKKCGGILVESTSSGGEATTLRYAVIGVGINVRHSEFPPELAPLATSLRIESDRAISREDVLIPLLRSLDRELTALEGPEAAGLLDRFAAASTWVRGMRVRVGEEGGYTGVTRGLDARGFLLVEDDGGQIRTVLSGGVRAL